MCNPRRIDVTATQHLREAWEHEVRRAATISGAATGRARIVESLDTTLGAPTLAALAQTLDRADGWVLDGDVYRYEMAGGYVAYHTDTCELEIVAVLAEELSATGEASRTVSGEVDRDIEASGSGIHYDDNWGGITEDDARREAERQAQRNLSAAREEALSAAQTAAAAEHLADLDASARAAATAELDRLVGERSAQLNEAAAESLAAIGVRGRNEFHRVLAEAYREAVLAYARVRGADSVHVVESDGVLEIEFEIQA
ncbi:molecular chaperone DnaJ [Actinoplanes aureus]|uniref:Molecular chaperone DnaJ n=1 Tax=Actinoplanes aureus TaxID=2792083 RepID=A0A931FWL1_9ACTN|nr:molecular chaperone DnaJ [Actinoplanes aureus]MBG0562558.1 molecular chaperone DnaJ [Actinoplanes aureus]